MMKRYEDRQDPQVLLEEDPQVLLEEHSQVIEDLQESLDTLVPLDLLV
jgi:hypothetical protein